MDYNVENKSSSKSRMQLANMTMIALQVQLPVFQKSRVMRWKIFKLPENVSENRKKWNELLTHFVVKELMNDFVLENLFEKLPVVPNHPLTDSTQV